MNPNASRALALSIAGEIMTAAGYHQGASSFPQGVFNQPHSGPPTSNVPRLGGGGSGLGVTPHQPLPPGLRDHGATPPGPSHIVIVTANTATAASAYQTAYASAGFRTPQGVVVPISASNAAANAVAATQLAQANSGIVAITTSGRLLS